MLFHNNTKPRHVNFNDAVATMTVSSSLATSAAKPSFAPPTKESLRILRSGCWRWG